MWWKVVTLVTIISIMNYRQTVEWLMMEDYSDQCCHSNEASFPCNACIMQSYFENELLSGQFCFPLHWITIFVVTKINKLFINEVIQQLHYIFRKASLVSLLTNNEDKVNMHFFVFQKVRINWNKVNESVRRDLRIIMLF